MTQQVPPLVVFAVVAALMPASYLLFTGLGWLLDRIEDRRALRRDPATRRPVAGSADQ